MANAIMHQSNSYANAINAALGSQQTTDVLSMSSKEIADLTGKQHKHVLRDIRVMLVELHGREHLEKTIPEQYRNRQSKYIRENAESILSAICGDGPNRDHVDFRGFSWERDARGYVSLFRLDKDHTLTLLTGYDTNARMRVIKRWQELETNSVRPQPNLPSPVQQAVDLTPGMLKVAELFGFEGNQAKLSANRAIRTFTGVDLLEAMGQKALIAPENEPLLTPTDIAVRLGIGKMSANPLLIAAGLQTGHRDHKNRLYYELTDLGLPHGVYLDVEKENGHGTPVRQLKWKASVLPALEAYMQIVS